MKKLPWSTTNALYQVPIRSFYDADGDGVGDIRGLLRKLPYLKESLGVGALWLTPFYPHGGVDFGYDVTEYKAIDTSLGTMRDLRELIDSAHGFGIKVMIDIVLNHTSEQHTWFQQSRSSQENPKSDWYIWRDAKENGEAPNNWLSKFGGSMWTFDEKRGQYYLHTFFQEQPDLNWQNPEVREAIGQIIRYWLDMGVDGLRADAAIYTAKDRELRDNPPNPAFREGDNERYRFTEDNISYGPDMTAFLRELTDIVAEYDNRLIVFEAYPEGKRQTRDRYGELYGVNPDVGMPLLLDYAWTDLTLEDMRVLVTDLVRIVEPGSTQSVFCFGSHDLPRLATRLGQERSRLAALFALSLPGIPIIYYGDELGMTDTRLKESLRQDRADQPHLPFGRDGVRTPMQWNRSKHAGFTTGTPWLPVDFRYPLVNVENQLRSSDSLLVLYRELLALRRNHAVFRQGDLEIYATDSENVLAFARRLGDEQVFVVLNFSKYETRHTLPHPGKILCSTHPIHKPTVHATGEVYLKPFEGVIVECKEHMLKTKGGI